MYYASTNSVLPLFNIYIGQTSCSIGYPQSQGTNQSIVTPTSHLCVCVCVCVCMCVCVCVCEQNWLPFHCAVANGHLTMVQLLLELDITGTLDFLREEDKQDVSLL